MANFAKITPIDLGDYRNKFLATEVLSANLFTAVATNGAGTPAYGAYFELKERDDKYVILVQNAHSTDGKDVTIYGGNDKIFSSGNNLAKEITALSTDAIKIDSGRYKFVENDTAVATKANISSVKGCVVIEGESTDIKICVIRMPA